MFKNETKSFKEREANMLRWEVDFMISVSLSIYLYLYKPGNCWCACLGRDL